MKSGKNVGLYTIAFKNLKYQSFKTIILFLLVFLMTIFLFASRLLVASMETGIEKTYERIGADLIVVPKNYVETVQNSLFAGKPSTVNFSKDWVQRLEKIEGVDKVSYQLYLATITGGCCEGGDQVIAIDPASDFTVRAWLDQHGKEPLRDGEIMVGSGLGKKVGESIRYFDREFIIKDVLEESGMGYDSSAFITFNDAYDIVCEPTYAAILPFPATEERVSSVLIKAEDGYSHSQLKENILLAYGRDEISVYSSGELVKTMVEQFNSYKIYGTWFEWIFILMTAVSIFAIYIVNIRQRYREFSCMSSIGFSFKQITVMLFEELAANVLLPGIIGTIATGGIFLLFRVAIKNHFQMPLLLPGSGEILLLGSYVVLLNLGISMLVYVYAIFRLKNTELALLVKEEN